jgi:peptidoglycan hydrolase CwlO-like protein
MRILYFTLFSALLLVFTFSVASFGDETPASEQPRRFTNEDLRKYNKPNDFTAPLSKNRPTADKTTASQKRDDTKEKEQWCKRGNHLRKKIEKIQAKLQDLKNKLSEVEEGTKKKKDNNKDKKTQKEIKKMEGLLKDTELEMSDLGAEAQRKGIPPGWPECRFEW